MRAIGRTVKPATIAGLFVFLASPIASGQQSPGAATSRPQSPAELTVAVLDFAANTPGEPELGKQISEALTVMLTGEPGFRLVDRSALTRALQELELNLSGVVDTGQAVQVGKVVGAQILVAGKAFAMGKEMFITAKLIGTETSLVDGVIAKGGLDADVGELVMQLSEKLSARLREVGPRLVAQDDAGQDALPALKAALAGLKKKPTIAVIIPERHMSRLSPVPDPAVETEIKRMLRECGFTVQDVPQNELTEFARSLQKEGASAWPRELAGVDMVIAGQGFSEFSARIGNLVSCAGRAEVNLVSRATGKILLAESTTERGVDLSENIAGKKALEKAGHTLGLRTLEHLRATLATP